MNTSSSNSLIQEVTLTGGTRNKSIIVNNFPVRGSFSFTKMSAKDGGIPLAGAGFTIYDQTPGAQGVSIGPFISDVDGIVSFTNIPFGTYELVENVTPEKHIPVITMFTIDTSGKLVAFDNLSNPGGLTVPLTMTNELSNMNIKITIVDGSDGNALMPGVTFNLRRNISGIWRFVEEGLTNSNGIVTFTGLVPGAQYRVEEVALTGYYQPGTYDFTVTGDDFTNTGNRSFTWVNHHVTSSIKVTTEDSVRGLSLDGVQFDLYLANGTTLVGSATTNSGGVALFDNVPLQYTLSTTDGKLYDTITLDSITYVVKEYAPKNGYVRDNTAHPVTLTVSEQNKEINLTSDPVTGSISFVKVNDWDIPLDGAVFKVTDTTVGSTVTQTATSETDGTVEFTGLPFGVYALEEITAPSDHEMDDTVYTVEIDTDGNVVPSTRVTKVVNPFLLSGSLKITMTDADTGEALVSVKFDLYDENDIKHASAVTDNNGVAEFPRLMTDMDYIVKEVTPEGYYANKPLEVAALANGEERQVEWRNYPYKASIEVTKRDSEHSAVKLSGAKFSLYATQDDAAAKQNAIAVQTTGQNGTVVFSKLALTQDISALSWSHNDEPVLQSVSYWLAETLAPNGYIINDTPKEVVLTYRDEMYAYTMDNTPVTGGNTPSTDYFPTANNGSVGGDSYDNGSRPGNPGGKISGSSAYTKGSVAGVIYIVNKDFAQFSDINVDNSALTRDKDYKAENGSTKITLLPAYLDTLNAGTYTLRVNFKDSTYATISFTVSAAAVTAKDSRFTDVSKSAWYYDAVMYVYEKGLMVGTADDTFSPNVELSRAMIVTILYRHAGELDVSGLTNLFDDVAAGQWYTDAVKWAADNGIITGYGNGKYAPETSVTRQDIAVILMRYMNYRGIVLPVNAMRITFADEDAISDYAMDAIQTFNKLGVINGTGTNAQGQTIVEPKGNATRAQAAMLLMNFLQMIEKQA